MKNYHAPADTINVTAPAAVTGGQLLLIGDMPCVAVGDAEAGATVSAMVEGAFKLPKAGVAISEGDTLNTVAGGTVTTAAGAKCGFALEDAAAGATEVLVKFAI
ncbi:MAG: capsid cement protein [Planctomycetota bacterium]